MGRRGAKSNPITLFSFQDIITSVTGIMILITLLMALELSQRQLQAPAVRTAVVVADLRPAVDEAEREIRELEARLEVVGEEVQELAGYDSRRLHTETADVEREMARLEADVVRIEALAREAQQKHREIEAQQTARQPDWDAAEELTRQLDETQRRFEKLRKSNRLIYNPARNAAKAAWLVEIADGGLSTAPLGTSVRPTTFVTGTATERLQAFLA